LELYLKGDILVDKTCVGGNPNESKYIDGLPEFA
jgi:hypothetical protein